MPLQSRVPPRRRPAGRPPDGERQHRRGIDRVRELHICQGGWERQGRVVEGEDRQWTRGWGVLSVVLEGEGPEVEVHEGPCW